MKRPSAPKAWQRLVAAAAPYRLRMEQTEYSLLPDLVILRPSDGLDIARMRYMEPEAGPPIMRSIFLHEVSASEQAQVEAHLAAALGPVIAEVYSAGMWIALLKLASER